MRHLVAVLALLAAASPLSAQFQPDPQYERILVPVFFSGPGANGADWATNLELTATTRNIKMPVPVLLGDYYICTLDVCSCDLKDLIEEGKIESVCPEFEDASGILLYVPRNLDPDELHIAARVMDRSRVSDRYGTAIPVVRERDAPDNPMILLDLPTDPRYRVALRLYDIFGYDDLYEVKFFDMNERRRGNEGLLLTTEIRVLVQPQPQGNPARFPMRPSFAFVGDLVAAYPQLASVPSIGIEITAGDLLISPPQPHPRFYALASITNNTTQEVTIVAPR